MDLDATAKKLNAETDSINSILQSIEAQLVNTRLGLEVWLEGQEHALSCVAINADTDEKVFEELGFGKLGDQWRLLVRDHSYADGSPSVEFSRGPLLQASRDTRIAAIKAMPGLISAMKRAGDEAVKVIATAKKLLA